MKTYRWSDIAHKGAADELSRARQDAISKFEKQDYAALSKAREPNKDHQDTAKISRFEEVWPGERKVLAVVCKDCQPLFEGGGRHN